MMAILRILLIFACIWLLFVLAWRQLRSMLLGSNAAKPRTAKRSHTRKEHSSVIPDDVGSYVDYTEVKE
jgi:hypothetical protein